MEDSDGLAARLIDVAGLTPEQVTRAREISAATDGDLAAIIASLGYVTRPQLYEAMADATGLPLVRNTERVRQHMDVRLVLKMSYQDVIEFQFMPFHFKDGTLVILTSNPRQQQTYDRCEKLFGVAPGQIAELLITDLDLTLIAARTFRDELVGDAILANVRRNPKQSARAVFTREQLYTIGAFLCGSVVWMYCDVKSFLIVMIALLQVYYLANVIFKTILSVAGARNEIEQPISSEELEGLNDENLPLYSILVPVYNEPEVVGHLIGALKKIDYPQHRLDVMLLLEEGDTVTLDAAKAAKPSANWRFIIVPNAQPRTKPKACNFGLFFARGKYLVIYDAEDVPEATQLKAAVLAFAKAPPEYVCFQAALNYFNASQNLLTRMFTLEYSYWFDYLIPGLDRLRLPIPLGGTSNHFDTEKLRGLGGWDPFNTTEDADLGIRAAAKGYRVGFINSTTYEEANADLGNWIRQRSRWIKGYMQTYLVYTRNPVALIKSIGLKDFVAFNLFIGGTPASFLSAPPLWGIFLFWLFTRTRLVEPLFPDAILYIALFNLLLGNFLGIYLNMIAVFLRKNYALLPFALLNPFYWLLHSIAAYKAAAQLITNPYYWEKTQHGLSKFSPKVAGK